MSTLMLIALAAKLAWADVPERLRIPVRRAVAEVHQPYGRKGRYYAPHQFSRL